MEYCINSVKFNINTIHDYNFTFLDNINIKTLDYYNIINSYEEFKIKNIYKYLYDRILLLNKYYDIKLMKKIHISDKISYNNFNDLLSTYIGNDKMLSIIIINSLQQYYHPSI
tara:strand:+ start:1020 stop:1358 length:339 start_codon:yes stop_codon:yes gene_type:complete